MLSSLTHVARYLRPTYIEADDPRSSTPSTHVAPQPVSATNCCSTLS
ncbi:MAG: hypothetical protein K6F74_04645 [Prevotella sp.]|nr:hypothetical protein [Prevotella sp.]